jgi:hypothetical protein
MAFTDMNIAMLKKKKKILARIAITKLKSEWH